MCTSAKNCSMCITDSFLFDNYCYGYCNLTDIFFNLNNQTCTSKCPAGSFSSVVFCKPCASTCITCVGNATTCISCSDGLYIENGKCTTQCSAQSKPTTTRECLYCGDKCGDPLDFATNVTQINGKSNIFLNFNRKINLKVDPY